MPVVLEGAGEQGPIAASRIGSLATEAEYIAQSGQEQLPEGLSRRALQGERSLQEPTNCCIKKRAANAPLRLSL